MHLTTPYQHATRRRCSCLLSGMLVKWILSLLFCFISPTYGEDDMGSSNSTEQPRTAAQGANIAEVGDEYCCRAPHYKDEALSFERKVCTKCNYHLQKYPAGVRLNYFPTEWRRTGQSKRTASTNHCPTRRSGFIRITFLRQEPINRISLGIRPRYNSLHWYKRETNTNNKRKKKKKKPHQ